MGKPQLRSPWRMQHQRSVPLSVSTYRGVDLEKLVIMPMPELIELVHARARRRFKHGLPRKYWSLLKRLRNAKKACNTAGGEKPVCIKTHLRNMIILPEMIGSV